VIRLASFAQSGPFSNLEIGRNYLNLCLFPITLIHCNPLLYLPVGPSILLNIPGQDPRWIGRQYKLSLDSGQQLQQPAKIILHISAVVTTIRIEVWRVAIKEALCSIPALDYIQGICTLQLNILEPDGIFLGEGFPFVMDLLTGGVRLLIKSPGSVQHAAKGLGGKYPNSPCPFDIVKKMGIGINYTGILVKGPGMKGDPDMLLQVDKILLQDLVEVNQLLIRII
jgi:hypothetical protein